VTKPATKPGSRKLSYKERRELDALPGLIESLEQRQAELEAVTGGADFYQREHTEVEEVLGELTRVQEQLDQAIERWAELEG
jgi:ATP-binding cassette subfamily F protein uup